MQRTWGSFVGTFAVTVCCVVVTQLFLLCIVGRYGQGKRFSFVSQASWAVNFGLDSRLVALGTYAVGVLAASSQGCLKSGRVCIVATAASNT